MDEENPWKNLSVLFLGLVLIERNVLFQGKSVKDEEGELYYKLYKVTVEVRGCEQDLREGSCICRD